MGYLDWDDAGSDDGADLFMPRDPDTGEPLPNGPPDDAASAPLTAETFLPWLAARHPRRMRRLRRDLAWVRDQAIRHGVDPDDIDLDEIAGL